MVAQWLHRSASSIQRGARASWLAVRSERDFVVSEATRLREVLPLIRSARRAGGLSAVERAALVAHLRRVGMLSPYLVVSLLPGSFVALPLIVWWRGRRTRG